MGFISRLIIVIISLTIISNIVLALLIVIIAVAKKNDIDKERLKSLNYVRIKNIIADTDKEKKVVAIYPALYMGVMITKFIVVRKGNRK